MSDEVRVDLGSSTSLDFVEAGPLDLPEQPRYLPPHWEIVDFSREPNDEGFPRFAPTVASLCAVAQVRSDSLEGGEKFPVATHTLEHVRSTAGELQSGAGKKVHHSARSKNLAGRSGRRSFYDALVAAEDAFRLGGRVGWLRLAVGFSLAVTPRMVVRLGAAGAPSGDMVLMTRTVGIRDFVLGLGAVQSNRSRSAADSRRWITLGLCSDLLDVAAGAMSARAVGRRGALIAALIPLPFVAADLVALVALNAPPDDQR